MNLIGGGILASVLLFATGCKPENKPVVNNPEEKVYKIECNVTESASSVITVEVAEEAKEAETVTVSVTLLSGNEGLYSPVVNVAGTEIIPAELIKTSEVSTGTLYEYNFAMPGEDVTVECDVKDIFQTISASLSPDFDPNFVNAVILTCPEQAKVNERVEFTFAVHPDLATVYKPVIDLKASETALEFEETGKDVSEQATIYSYAFTMPAESVTLVVDIIENINPISTEMSGVASIWVYNGYYGNEGVHESTPGRLIGFVYTAEFGYTLDTPKVIVTSTGEELNVWWNETGDFNGYSYDPGWAFTMPDEPVTIVLNADELTTYAGKSFVGEYKGNEIKAGISTGAATFTLNYNANTSYAASSTDGNALNFNGVYSVNEETGFISYDRGYTTDPANTSHPLLPNAADARLLANGDALVMVTNLVMDTPENMFFYYVSKNEITSFISVSRYTEWLRDCVLEVEVNGQKLYYFFDYYAYKLLEAEVVFKSGNTLAETSEAIFYVDGKAKVKYTRTDGGKTSIVDANSEAGTYTGENGDIVLDGFGGVTVGGEEGTYTYTSSTGELTVTIGGVETKYIIDKDAKTYTVVAPEPEGWAGLNKYSGTGIMGEINYKSADSGTLTVYVDQDASGNLTPGQGAVVASLNIYGQPTEAFNCTAAYEYDAAAKTLTFKDIALNTNGGSSNSDVVFNVSDDLQTLTLPVSGMMQMFPAGSSSIYIMSFSNITLK